MAELTREILIDASPATIFPLLTDAEKHLLWEGTAAEVDARPGGTYRVLMAGQYQSGGAFVEVVPDEKVVFTFGWDVPDHPIPAGSTTVEITLHPQGDQTLVRLRHHGLPEDAVDDHIGGWTHYLGRLVVAASGGVNGPDAGPGGD